jgi:hypothetical protein
MREDVLHSTPKPRQSPWQQFEQLVAPQERSSKNFQHRVQIITQHMGKQWQAHQLAVQKTNQLFSQLLDDLYPLCDTLKNHMALAGIPIDKTGVEVDPDRSVGILSVQWHSISYTIRGNSKPLALNRLGKPPMFSGRIIALAGDFHEMAMDLQSLSFPELLQYELASLYVPDEDTAPAVMRARHMGEEETFFHPMEAARMFLLKTVEMTCGGGVFHEADY